MKIVQATEHDYQTVCNLCRDLDNYHINIAGGRVKPYSGVSRTREQYNSYICGDDRELFIATQDGIAVGFINLLLVKVEEEQMRTGRRYVLLDNMFVLEAYRKHGVASTLFKSSTNWCKELGVSKIELQVYSANKDALAFYESMGFSPLMQRLELNVD